MKRHDSLQALFVAMIFVFIGIARLPVPSGELRISFQLIMELGIIMAFALFLMMKVNLWIGIFLVMAGFSMVYPQYSRWSYLGFQAVFYASVWFLFLWSMMEKDKIPWVLNAMCIIALVHLSILFLQQLGCAPFFKPVDPNTRLAVGLMANQNEISALLAISLPAFVRGRWKYFIPAIILGLFLSRSMGGLFAVGIGFVFYQTMKGRFLLPLALVIIAVLIYALLIDSPGFERLVMWQYGAEVGRERWLLGGGIGHWKIVMKDILAPHLGGTWCATAHSDIFQLWFEMGIAPILLICGYLWSVARRFKTEALIAVTALIVILANSMVHFLFHIATTGIIAVTWIAILEIQFDRGNPNYRRYKDGPAIAY